MYKIHGRSSMILQSTSEKRVVERFVYPQGFSPRSFLSYLRPKVNRIRLSIRAASSEVKLDKVTRAVHRGAPTEPKAIINRRSIFLLFLYLSLSLSLARSLARSLFFFHPFFAQITQITVMHIPWILARNGSNKCIYITGQNFIFKKYKKICNSHTLKF